MNTIVRETRETRVEVLLRRGTARPDVATGRAFLDHMLVTLATCSGLELTLRASGDLPHHLIEDTALTLGEAFARLAPERAARYGARVVPMDDALVQVAVDLGGRPYYEGPLPSRMYDHWLRSFAMQSRSTLHARVLRGTDRHHVVEAAFKALGLALRDALVEGDATFSTKGSVRWSTPGEQPPC